MNTKEIEKFIKQSVIKELDNEYKVHKDYILKYPVQDIVVGFCLERSSSPNEIYLNILAQPLYMLNKYFLFLIGGRIKNSFGYESWIIKDSDEAPQYVSELISAVKANYDFIKEMQNPDVLYSYLEKHRGTGNIRIIEAQVYTAFWLRKYDAKIQAQDLINSIIADANIDISIPWIQGIVDDLKVLIETDDPIAILKEYKIQTIENLKL